MDWNGTRDRDTNAPRGRAGRALRRPVRNTGRSWARGSLPRALAAALSLAMVATLLTGPPGVLEPPTAAADPAVAAAEPFVLADEVRTMAMRYQADSHDAVGWASADRCPEDGSGDVFVVPPCMIRASSGASALRNFRSVWFNGSSIDRDPDLDLASNLTSGRFNYFWATVGGEIVRLNRGAGSVWTDEQEPIPVAQKADPTTSSEVAVNDTHVYWTENTSDSGALYRVPRRGDGPRELVYVNDDSPMRQLAVDESGGALFVASTFLHLLCCIDVLHRVTPDGAGGFDVELGTFMGVEAHATFEDTVYFITSLGGSHGPELHAAPVDDLANTTRLALLDAAGDPAWPALAAGETAVYWQEVRTFDEGPIFRLTLGGSPEPVTGNLPRATQLAVTNDRLFAHVDTEILRYDREELTALRLDLVADEIDLEVVQVIQNSDSDVPLVAGKPTFVRLHSRIAESSEGRDWLSPSPFAVLHGSRDGIPLPDSPLEPVPRHVHARWLRNVPEINRANLATTVLFELPESWADGTVTLRGEINPGRVLAETDYSNNVSEREVTFFETRGVCLDIIPVRTVQGDSVSGFRPEVLPLFSRAESVLPFSVSANFGGGTPKTRPWINDPYDMSSKDHQRQLMFNLTLDFMFSSPPGNCGDRTTIRTVLVPDSEHAGGMSNSTAPIIWVRTQWGESFSALPENDPFAGLVIAHEIGHQLGQGHVGCPLAGEDGAPGGVDGNYPYHPCQLDDANEHIGFDAISRRLIVPLGPDGASWYRDLMSYLPPYWASDYTYRRIFDNADPRGPAPTAVGGAFGASTDDSSSSGVLLAGFLPDDGADAEVGFAYQLEDSSLADALARIDEATEPSADHELHVYGEDDELLFAGPLNVGMLDHLGPSHEGSLLFLHVLDVDTAADAVRVEVVATTGADPDLLASRTAGVAPPEVSVTSPAVDDLVGDTMTVEWTGTDPDGDDLAYVVRYSADGGETWTALASDLTGTTLSVDMTGMPGSDEAFLEVIASDGLRSTAAQVGPFTVETKAPDVAILTPDLEPLDEGAPATIRQSDPLVLRGYAFDPEDGELSGDALQWELDGPVHRTGSGEVLRLRDLPPGQYDVTLEATDGDGAQGLARTTLHVEPKLVPAATVAAGGFCDDPGYHTDDDPLVLRYSDGAIAEVRAVHTDDDLFACFSGLPETGDLDSVELRIDLDGDGGGATGPRHLVVLADNTGGAVLGWGDGTGDDDFDLDTESFEVTTGFGDGSWSIQLRVERDVIGEFEGIVGLRASHERGGGAGAAWPAESSAAVPDTWGLATFGAGGLVVTTPAEVVGDEGSPIPLEGAVSGVEGASVSTEWTVSAEAPCTFTDDTALATTLTCANDGVFTATLTAISGEGTAAATTRVVVRNVAPSVGPLDGPAEPVRVGTEVTIDAPFTDPGVDDTHRCEIEWGDGTVEVIDPAVSPCSASHVYTSAGLYLVTAVVTDDGGAAGLDSLLVVVYDPDAGFLTGGGWFDSPKGAYVADPTLTERVHFTLASRYDADATQPHGNVRVWSGDLGFEFRASSFDWMVVTDPVAVVRGSGTVNGQPGFEFLIAAGDGDRAEGSDQDRLSVRIWEADTGAPVFHNGIVGVAEHVPTDPVTGSIVVHAD